MAEIDAVLLGQMMVSPRDLVALGVFSTEWSRSGNGSKEGLSLYGILCEKIKTSMGRKLLKSWVCLLCPSCSILSPDLRCFDRPTKSKFLRCECPGTDLCRVSAKLDFTSVDTGLNTFFTI